MNFRSNSQTLAALAAAFFLTASPAPSLAWGRDGHQLVAQVADRQLAPRARSQVEHLLALEPGATLASISTWADEHRSPSTAAWHYVNLPRGACTYVPPRDCPDGRCVVAAIERQADLLANESNAAGIRLQALKYLVHLVADIHQPFHAGSADDKGGNLYQLQAFGGRGTNLHAVWDSGLIEHAPEGTEQFRKAVLAATPAKALASGTPATWAEESCQVVWANRAELYPTGHRLEADYATRMTPVVRDRLVRAGARLAALLNAKLGHSGDM